MCHLEVKATKTLYKLQGICRCEGGRELRNCETRGGDTCCCWCCCHAHVN